MTMFTRHVGRQLSAYCHDELSPEEARRVKAHLTMCARCRTELEEIQRGIALAERIWKETAPDTLWSRIEAALDEQATARMPSRLELPVRRPVWIRITACAGACAMLVFAILRFRQPTVIKPLPEGPSWQVTRVTGAPIAGPRRVGKFGKLHIGEELVTDGVSQASLDVANIGHVVLEPNSRLRLVVTRPNEHRIALQQGRMSAQIKAPPRLFFVDTPSAVAVDLGCAYTLTVNAQKESLLHVTFGRVSFEKDGREVTVFSDARCKTVPGIGPGTPWFDDARPALVQALDKFDFRSGGDTALNAVLNNARPKDSFTLINLLQHATGGQRAAVYTRLAKLVEPPMGVTREGLLKLDPAMLTEWQNVMKPLWDEIAIMPE
jgi:anti-sigma factor RsiW